MSKVEGGGPIEPPLRASCNYFLFEASRVNLSCFALLYLVGHAYYSIM